MALYIPQSILHLARSLYVRPETYGPTYVHELGPKLYIFLDRFVWNSVYLVGLHVMPLSSCGRCAMGAERAIHLLRVKMGCCIYFVNFSAELSRIAKVDVHKPSLSD